MNSLLTKTGKASLVGSALLLATACAASAASLFTPITPLPGVSARADGPYTIGNSFTVGSMPLVVDSLGAMDTTGGAPWLGSDGFVAGSVQVGLWTGDGTTLLASATVASTDPIGADNYRYHTLAAPVTLSANTTYLIGARVGAGIEWFLDAYPTVVVTADATITLVQSGYGTGGALTAPVNNGGVAGRWAAANASFSTNAPPAAPTIFTQPQSATRFQGDSVTFTVGASGVPVPAFQWYKNSTNLLAGATNLTLTLTNLGVADSGNYSLTAVNSAGSITSSNAVLTVLNPPLDTTSDMLTHLKFDETTGLTAFDSTTNANNGLLAGFPGDDTQWIRNGRINGAIDFLPASSGYQTVVIVPDAAGTFDFSTNLTFTLSAWFRGSSNQVDGAAVICKGSGLNEQYCFDVYQGKFRFYCRDAATNATVLNTPAELNGTWQHVVVVFSAPFKMLRFYLNGIQVAATTPPASLYSNTHDVSIGNRELSASGSGGYNLPLVGDIDDVRLYDRALSPADVLALYNEAPLPVSFVQPPQNADLFVGDTLRLTAAVDGTRPINWQWLKNGAPLAGATANNLNITNVQTSDAGSYRLVAANAANTVTSAVATVTVNNPAVDLAGGLVMHLKLDETSGLTATDATTNANNGVLLNFLDPVPTNWVAGVLSGALLFNSGAGVSNQAVVVNDSASLDFSTTAAFSLSAWIKGPPQPGASTGIICKGFGNGGEAFCMDIYGSSYRFFVRDASAVITTLQSAFAPKNNTWQLLVATHDAAGGRMKLYVNGLEAASGTPAASILATAGNPVNIGCRQDANGEYNYPFLGAVDDVRIYNRALTPMEQRALYEAVVPPPVSLMVTPSGGGLVISWPTAASGFTLEAAPMLPSATWTNVPGVVNNSVTITPMGGSLFYRLRR